MDLNKKLLIEFIATMTGEDFTSVKKSIIGVTTEEEHDNDLQTYIYNDSLVCVSEYYDLAIIYNLKNKDNYNYNHLIQLSPFATYYEDGKGPYQERYYNCGDRFDNAHDFAESVEKIINCELFRDMDSWESYVTLTALLNECSLTYCAEHCDNFYIEDTETLFNDCYCVPENVSSYIDYDRFEEDLTYDNYISLGGRVLYYGC